jgi:hypothetical protein
MNKINAIVEILQKTGADTTELKKLLKKEEKKIGKKDFLIPSFLNLGLNTRMFRKTMRIFKSDPLCSKTQNNRKRFLRELELLEEWIQKGVTLYPQDIFPD